MALESKELVEFKKDLKKMVKSLAKKHGMDINVGRVSIYGNSFNCKLTGIPNNYREFELEGKTYTIDKLLNTGNRRSVQFRDKDSGQEYISLARPLFDELNK